MWHALAGRRRMLLFVRAAQAVFISLLFASTVSVEQLQPADWRRVLDVNLTSVFEVCLRVVPLMKQSGWGRIVNMASVAAKEGFTNFSAYSSASAGVVAFMKALGKALASTAIRVNVVAPAGGRFNF